MSSDTLRVLDLFSGIGGFSLGLERAGMKTVAFCEIEPFCQRVLAKHWPGVPCYDDIQKLTADRLRDDGITVDVICGGFPCQDISVAGKGAGLAGARSGLWSEYARIIGELRPHYVIVENVAALLGRGMGTVLGDLAALGYDAEWHCIPASAIGAPHRRDRIWIIAYRQSVTSCANADSIGPYREKINQFRETEFRDKQISVVGPVGEELADAESQRRAEKRQYSERSEKWASCGSQVLAHADGAQREGMWFARRISKEYANFGGSSWWFSEPDVGRVAHGVPSRVDRLKSLGNAVVPQIPEIIGKAIVRHHNHD